MLPQKKKEFCDREYTWMIQDHSPSQGQSHLQSPFNHISKRIPGAQELEVDILGGCYSSYQGETVLVGAQVGDGEL